MTAHILFSPGCGCCPVPVCFLVQGCGHPVEGATVTVSGPLPGGATVEEGVTDSDGRVCLSVPMGATYRATATHPKSAEASADFVPASGLVVTLPLSPPSEGYGPKVCVPCCPFPLSRRLHLQSLALGDFTLVYDDATQKWGTSGIVTAQTNVDFRTTIFDPAGHNYLCGYVWGPDGRITNDPKQVTIAWECDGCSIAARFNVAKPPGGCWGLWPDSNGPLPDGWTSHETNNFTAFPPDDPTSNTINSCDPFLVDFGVNDGFPADSWRNDNCACVSPETVAWDAVFGHSDRWTFSEES